jgi:CheY-like chemotaxis protein
MAEKRLRVLFVDDDELVRRVYARQIGAFADVTAASSGEAALEMIRTGTWFDAVVADVSMGGMSGVELYKQLCVVRPGMESRFIAVTGNDPDSLDQRFCKALGDRLLFKPVALDDLEQVVPTDGLQGMIYAVANSLRRV